MGRRTTVHTLLAGVLALGLPGCGDDGASAQVDAGGSGDAGVAADAAIGSDSLPPLNWVDFAVTGCETPDGDAGVMVGCAGEAALALTFTAIAPAAVDVYRWRFGDGQESMESSPSHLYAEPGVYDVSLVVGGPGGTATKLKEAAVVVRGGVMGAPCNADTQCGTALDCICDDDDGCGPALIHGLCAAACDVNTACEAGVCADLAPGAPASPADWQRTMCLPECDDSSDCAAGLACRALRSGDGGGWITACFSPALLGDIGDACADGQGQLDGARCTSGTCSPLGARGACSEACTAQSCPSEAACATFSAAGLGSLCVARCEEPGACELDPWLACEAPGGPAPKGFTVDEAAATDGYCAPKRCAGAAECGPDGACVNGYCAAM